MEELCWEATLHEKKALRFAIEKHKGQMRLGGSQYIDHPIAVANYLYSKGYRNEFLLTALFHDLLEDTDATVTEIEQLGNENIVEAVVLLTKTREIDTEQYLTNIKANNLAFIVKVSDRIQNLKDSEKADLKFREKYVEETIRHYLEFAKRSPFFKELNDVLSRIKNVNVSERGLVQIADVKVISVNKGKNHYLVKGNLQCNNPMSLIYSIDKKEFENRTNATDIIAELYAVPKCSAEVFLNEIEYYDINRSDYSRLCETLEYDYKYSHQNISQSAFCLNDDDKATECPTTRIAGVVHEVGSPIPVLYGGVECFITKINVFGIKITLLMNKFDFQKPSVDNIIDGHFQLYAKLY
ncbi:bifunctional (p)ppGpp synthetase/guanosine-3',5'-bis(diphosphate) 3'-pyrophosphohydrolase [Clostridia bacterium]|nr:bifunctional (p)ppGpp synthetase/guanosine-3',5'-bis(diphosphate) 3'-pyrophosphohydrolase [Clostridia bacterium]